MEIDAEVWELLRKGPATSSLVILDGANQPVELRGEEVLRLLEDDKIKLYPAKYRLRQNDPE